MWSVNFEEIGVPADLAADHKQRGGAELRRHTAAVADGVLRVMSGKEPIGRLGPPLLHVSVSVGVSAMLACPPSRRPTDEEMRAVRSLFPEADLEEDNDCGSDPMIRHLWQVDK
jgi:hypothetical protein